MALVDMENPNLAEHTKVRVLHIISGDLWAGAEVQAYTLMTHLIQYCDVHAVVLNDAELAHKLQLTSVTVTLLDETRLSSWQIYGHLKDVLLQYRPQIVHTHRLKENVLGAVANFVSIKARCVRTSHGAPEFQLNWKRRITYSLDRWVGRLLQDQVIAVSDELKQKLVGAFKADHITVINNGVDCQWLKSQVAPVDFKTTYPTHQHIGIIGRLVPVKRIDIFLDMAQIFVQQKLTQYRFHIIGEGPLRKTLEEKSQALGLENWVEFHGHRSDIPSCIHALDAVVMCSDHEGMPITALETLALGTHFVTSLPSLIKTLQLDLLAPKTQPIAQFLFDAILALPPGKRQYRYDVDVRASVLQTFQLYKLLLNYE